VFGGSEQDIAKVGKSLEKAKGKVDIFFVN
jgi:hypothetical protein